jgi:transcription antitermination factor NusG
LHIKFKVLVYILKLASSENPSLAQSVHLIRLLFGWHLGGNFMREWFVLYLKAKHEFATNAELQKKSIETFLPSVRRWRQWSDRKKLIDFPLFPGYLFVHVRPESEEFLSAVKTRGAVTFVTGEPGRPSPVPPEEINSLRILLEKGDEFDIYPHLKAGDPVRVRKGPLKGAEGILLRKEKQYMFFVNINLLGRSVGLKIHSDDIDS